MNIRSFMYAAAIAVISISTSPAFAQDAQPQKLNYEELVDYYFAQRPEVLTEHDLLDSYALFKDCKAYKQKYMLNEFEARKYENDLKKGYEAWQEELKQGVDAPEDFVITMTSKFGEYDFDTGSFSFKPFPQGTYIPVNHGKKSVYDCFSNSPYWPNQFDVIFENGQMFDGLPISEELAAKVPVQKGRNAMLGITAKVKSINLNYMEGGKAIPQIKAEITKMKVTHIGRKSSWVFDVLHDFTVDEVKDMTAAWEEEAKSIPMMANTQSFSAWAAKFGVDKYAKKFGVDADTVDLKPIAFEDKRSNLDYDRKSNKYEPAQINDDGTANTKLFWSGGAVDDSMAFNTEMGTIVLNFNNAGTYKGMHKIPADMVKFLSGLDYASMKAEMRFTPLGAKIVTSESGREELHFDVRIDGIQYFAQNAFGGGSIKKAMFTQQTIVKE